MDGDGGHVEMLWMLLHMELVMVMQFILCFPLRTEGCVVLVFVFGRFHALSSNALQPSPTGRHSARDLPEGPEIRR